MTPVKNAYLERIKEKTKKEIAGLTQSEIAKKYDELHGKISGGLQPMSLAESVIYEEYWLANAKDDPKGFWSAADQIKYPRFCWVNQDIFPGLQPMINSLQKLVGVVAGHGTMFMNSNSNIKAYWGINFLSVAALNHFMWAGCGRYFCLSRNDDWRLDFYDADPDYSSDKIIRTELKYLNLTAPRAKWEQDFREFSDGINNYANSQYNK